MDAVTGSIQRRMMWVLYIAMGLLFLLLVVLCIPFVLDTIVELKEEWKLFRYRMRGDR